MSEEYAVRDISKCTKDCLCLYVCPTGATDTENSIIDKNKCIGCKACSQACPSKAIFMAKRDFPVQQKHSTETIKQMHNLCKSKIYNELYASIINTKLSKAIEKSSRIMAEDIIRESGYMLPQSANTKQFLEYILKTIDDDSIKNKINILLNEINFNEPISDADDIAILKNFLSNTYFETNSTKKSESKIENVKNENSSSINIKYECTICGHIHNGELPENFACPVCNQPKSVFKQI